MIWERMGEKFFELTDNDLLGVVTKLAIASSRQHPDIHQPRKDLSGPGQSRSQEITPLFRRLPGRLERLQENRTRRM